MLVAVELEEWLLLTLEILVLIGLGCYNRISQTRWHKQQTFISHCSGGEGPLPGSQM